MTSQPIQGRRAPLIRAGVVLGLGFGGFFDGIVFHQVLQWHHILSSRTAPTTVDALRLNTFADGLFHSATYVLTFVGLWMLFQAVKSADVIRSNRVLLGAMLAGFGVFNLVEGIVNHHILQIHHVRAGENETLFDLAFLLSGVILIAAGTILMRRRHNEQRI